MARCPNDINLAEVYKAVNCGGVIALHTKAPSQDCPIGKNIEAVLGCLQREIEKGIEEKLSRYTLQNVFEMVDQGKG